MGKTYYKTIPIKTIKDSQIESMFKIFQKYYDNVSLSEFEHDLKKKDHVIILYSKAKLIGFSTITHIDLLMDGKKVVGLFSGDTIVEKEYWGNNKLCTAFGNYLYMMKFKNPGKTLYWFLISKGHKTYLLMTNNFPVHYPRYDKVTPPDYQKLIQAFGTHLYPNEYNQEKNLIIFNRSTCKLRSDLSQLMEEIKTPNPKINYFVKMNPNWHQGDELCCIAKVSLTVPIRYFFKQVKKTIQKKLSL